MVLSCSWYHISVQSLWGCLLLSPLWQAHGAAGCQFGSFIYIRQSRWTLRQHRDPPPPPSQKKKKRRLLKPHYIPPPLTDFTRKAKSRFLGLNDRQEKFHQSPVMKGLFMIQSCGCWILLSPPSNLRGQSLSVRGRKDTRQTQREAQFLFSPSFSLSLHLSLFSQSTQGRRLGLGRSRTCGCR